MTSMGDNILSLGPVNIFLNWPQDRFFPSACKHLRNIIFLKNNIFYNRILWRSIVAKLLNSISNLRFFYKMHKIRLTVEILPYRTKRQTALVAHPAIRKHRFYNDLAGDSLQQHFSHPFRKQFRFLIKLCKLVPLLLLLNLFHFPVQASIPCKYTY